ncbi:DUF2878 domain-containing protein [Vibrio sp. SCSIO 43135]|uniref:DUF2878 domain-containing protein n=1 Tax=Vibrio paucivorans TaxID=2829489 RepID=A0A9X3CEI1_9VIBR|nr:MULTISPECIES: DUF2878 domain-containing protein [Vibrio]MCW8334200.1 DUF2878 domain-containing protein [Vibrio paucivorans]USD43436.1 DUF2878 domain-containing protein [Vibrio sp. SCSIO 43135]
MKRFWITNFLLFQASWFSAAFYTQHAIWLITGLLFIHFLFSPTKRADLKLLPLALIGVLLDKIHLIIGTFLPSDLFTSIDTFFPAWLILLWVMFVLTLNHSLSWLLDKPLFVNVIFGAIGGAISYWAGIQAGALSSDLTNYSLLITLALSWGVLFPTLVSGTRYINQQHLLTDN